MCGKEKSAHCWILWAALGWQNTYTLVHGTLFSRWVWNCEPDQVNENEIHMEHKCVISNALAILLVNILMCFQPRTSSHHLSIRWNEICLQKRIAVSLNGKSVCNECTTKSFRICLEKVYGGKWADLAKYKEYEIIVYCLKTSLGSKRIHAHTVHINWLNEVILCGRVLPQ